MLFKDISVVVVEILLRFCGVYHLDAVCISVNYKIGVKENCSHKIISCISGDKSAYLCGYVYLALTAVGVVSNVIETLLKVIFCQGFFEPFSD